MSAPAHLGASSRAGGRMPWFSMGLLDRYVARHVMGGVALALVVLLALFSIGALFDDLDDVGRGSYGVRHALAQVLLEVPGLVYALFPLAALIGALLGLGVLSGNSELLVMRTAGLSLARQSVAVLKAAVLLGLLALFIGDALAPVAERAAVGLRARVAQGDVGEGLNLNGVHGAWLRDGRSFVNVRSLRPDGRFTGVQIYEFDGDRRLRVATRADSAARVEGEWWLEGVEQSVLASAGSFQENLLRPGAPVAVTSVRAVRARWDTDVSPELLDPASARPERLSLSGLRRYIRYLKHNQLDSRRMELSFWSKLISPVSTAVMVFLALPLALGRLRAAGVGLRLLVGAAVGVGFHVANQIAGQSGIVYGLNPLVSAAAPTAAFALVGLLLLRRVR